MENLAFLLSLSFFFSIISFPIPLSAVSSCNSPCRNLNDCEGQLICINSKCNDDPNVGTHICTSGGGITPSPPDTSSIPAKLTNNDFTEAGGSGPAECDERYHKNSERVVALSTRWYNGGSRCGKFIKITARNGKSTIAKVVDECDSRNGCGNNIVDGSDAVWNDLGLDINVGIVDITWSMA